MYMKERPIADSSLKDYRGRLQPPLRNSRGNFYRSVIQAGYYELVEGTPGYYAFTQNYTVLSLLFVSDTPVLMHWQTWFEADAAPSFPATNYHEFGTLFGDPTYAGVSGWLTADDLGIHYPGRAMRGTLVGSGIKVAGFLTSNLITNRTEQLTGQTPLMKFEAVCQSGVIAGGYNYDSDYPPAAVGRREIVLKASDYTAAMKAAGDVFTVAGTTYEIVGLFAQYIPT